MLLADVRSMSVLPPGSRQTADVPGCASSAPSLGADPSCDPPHSVPDQFLEKWEFEGEQRSFSDPTG